MESPSASIPATSPDDPFPSVMTPQPERPEQGKFSTEEIIFLKSHLPAFGALCCQLAEQATGPRGTGSVKGRKKDWILSKIFPEFVKQFSSDQADGPQLQSLQVKILRWFMNHSPHRNPTASSRSPSKRPRATNSVALFAEEHKTIIAERMAEQQEQEGGIPKQVNLSRYHRIKHDLYSRLTDEQRLGYETKATKTNEEYNLQPDKSEIFKNQGDILNRVVKSLHDFIGWDWGQCGDVVFFVQGAYRNADNDLQAFNVSVSPNAKITDFASTLPEYKTALRAPFRKWAESALPSDTNTDVEQPVNEPPTPRDVDIDESTNELEKLTPTTAPVINPPVSIIPPLSESMIKDALKNVAAAGYLTIDPPHQDLQHLEKASLQSDKEKTSYKKRKPEEMEPDGANVKQMKKKLAVPTREQSLRLKDANYRNTHVTVRPR